MQHQARREPAAGIRLPHRPSAASAERTVDDYVADLLLAHIAPETVEQLSTDEQFLRACIYPVLD